LQFFNADINDFIEIIAFYCVNILNSLRIYKAGRDVWQKFGVFVITLSFAIKNIFVWLLFFLIFWTSFTSAFFIQYGKLKYAFDRNESLCNNDVADEDDDDASCQLIEIDDMRSYPKTLNTLWIFAFGRDLDLFDQLKSINPFMTDILTVLFVAIFLLLLVNIFIALLTTTFDR
jgi:hypothetical protein